MCFCIWEYTYRNNNDGKRGNGFEKEYLRGQKQKTGVGNEAIIIISKIEKISLKTIG